MKKTIFFIILGMLIFTLPVSGREFYDTENTKYEIPVELLSSLGIIDGYPDGSFRPEGKITRAEISKLITIIMGYKDFSVNIISNFKDMEGHWAQQYVDIMDSLDVVKGYLDGTFGPENNVTYSESVTMIIRSLGYTDNVLPGEWPADYFLKAGELGITEGVAILAGEATRGDVTLMLYNALKEETGNIENEMWTSSGKDLLNRTGSIREDLFVTDETIKEFSKDIDLRQFLYYRGDLYLDRQGKPVYFDKLDTSEFQGMVTLDENNRIAVSGSGGIQMFEKRNAVVRYNGVETTAKNLTGADVKVIYRNDSDTKTYGIIAEMITKVALAEKIYSGETIYSSVYIPSTQGQSDTGKVEVMGDAGSIYDIAEGDMLYFYETNEPSYSKSYLKIFVYRKRAQGILQSNGSNNSQGYGIIDGVRYEHSSYYKPAENLSSGYYVSAVLDMEGKIVQYKSVRYVDEPENYGILTEKYDSTSRGNVQIKLLDENGYLRQFRITENADNIIEINKNGQSIFSLDIAVNSLVKYNLNKNDMIDRIFEKETAAYSGRYDGNSNILVDNKIPLNYTAPVYRYDNGQWILVSEDELDEIISGEIALSSSKNSVEAIVLYEGLRTDLPGRIVGVIQNSSIVTNLENKAVAKLYVLYEGSVEIIFTSEDYEGELSELKDVLLVMNLRRDRITEIQKAVPETEKSVIDRILNSRLIQTEDGAFWPLAEDYEVYIADSEGIIERYGDTEDLRKNAQVTLYDLNGNYDGYIDYIVLYE